MAYWPFTLQQRGWASRLFFPSLVKGINITRKMILGTFQQVNPFDNAVWSASWICAWLLLILSILYCSFVFFVSFFRRLPTFYNAIWIKAVAYNQSSSGFWLKILKSNFKKNGKYHWWSFLWFYAENVKCFLFLHILQKPHWFTNIFLFHISFYKQLLVVCLGWFREDLNDWADQPGWERPTWLFYSFCSHSFCSPSFWFSFLKQKTCLKMKTSAVHKRWPVWPNWWAVYSERGIQPCNNSISCFTSRRVFNLKCFLFLCVLVRPIGQFFSNKN